MHVLELLNQFNLKRRYIQDFYFSYKNTFKKYSLRSKEDYDIIIFLYPRLCYKIYLIYIFCIFDNHFDLWMFNYEFVHSSLINYS